MATRILALLVLALTATSAGAVDLRDILGSTHAGGKYNFTEKDYLNEGADRLLELGTRVIKVWFQLDAERLYPFNSDWEPRAENLAELARKPYYRDLFAKPFTTFILVVPQVTVGPQFHDGMSAEEVQAEKDHLYHLARHLLVEYAGTGKTFILQNWEGDHLLRQSLPAGTDPDLLRLEGMRDWWNARQDGVDQARRENPAAGVRVFHAAEVNHLADAMAGKITAASHVLPYTRADLYSYSSWDLRFDRARLTQALDYLKAQAPDSAAFGEDNIYLGEYGVVRDQVGEGVSLRNTIRGLTEAALGWGVRYAVFWQLFCNEAAHVYEGRPLNSDMRGFWLIRPDGSRAASWRDFQKRLSSARSMVRLRIATGQFVGAENGGDDEVVADRWKPTPWTLFAINDLNGAPLRNGDPVTLQAHNGLYLTSEDTGGPVYARSFEPGLDETFRLWKAEGSGVLHRGDPIAIQSASSGNYVTAETGTGQVTATRASRGRSETFLLLIRER